MVDVKSPCILVCSIDVISGCCFGCGRTRAEIANWLSMSSQERDTVMEELSARLEQVERRPRRETRRARIARQRMEGQ
ncbi:DUF1289 domain-containing protein [Nitratireductor kimnyeongensis]|uniref:DUF1289 domain-containing protein n=1 Tax=Nitratireductor kimnyeongensis TaxID=430679 RepID=A0ABW0TBB0_9HYPH|nr:DUF1289 domain-containing protein [Nitratireductor kimnyeongensis]QZZ37247.1 DUF1289 domain-containing protein [Nitratireductor kimnyeongensis]